jgi:hypothetical protein
MRRHAKKRLNAHQPKIRSQFPGNRIMLRVVGLALRSASANGCGGVMKASGNKSGTAAKVPVRSVAKAFRP